MRCADCGHVLAAHVAGDTDDEFDDCDGCIECDCQSWVEPEPLDLLRAWKRANEGRDPLIREARRDGATYAELGDATGLSRARLDRIINHRD